MDAADPLSPTRCGSVMQCVVISSRAADAVIVSTEIRRDHTRRRRPPSTQTLLLGRLLGPVGVYGGRRPTRRRDGRACTCSLLRPSALRMLVAWGRASQTPESTHNAYTRGARWGGVEPLQSCVSASGSADDARFFFFFFFFFSEPSSDLARFFDGFASAGGGGGGNGPSDGEGGKWMSRSSGDIFFQRSSSALAFSWPGRALSFQGLCAAWAPGGRTDARRRTRSAKVAVTAAPLPRDVFKLVLSFWASKRENWWMGRYGRRYPYDRSVWC